MSKKLNHRLPVLHGDEFGPPPTYGHCIVGGNMTDSGNDKTSSFTRRMMGQAQCTAFNCRYNLLFVRSEEMPGKKHNGQHPEGTVTGKGNAGSWSCALDVAKMSEGRGGVSCAEIADHTGESKRRVEQRAKAAMASKGGVELYKLRGELMGNMEEE